MVLSVTLLIRIFGMIGRIKLLTMATNILLLSEVLLPMATVYTTWQVMSPSGVMIGMTANIIKIVLY
jgi:hypothetical protein